VIGTTDLAAWKTGLLAIRGGGGERVAITKTSISFLRNLNVSLVCSAPLLAQPLFP
jgi:hypothetical protein